MPQDQSLPCPLVYENVPLLPLAYIMPQRAWSSACISSSSGESNLAGAAVPQPKVNVVL
jgi:hypothetical protein